MKRDEISWLSEGIAQRYTAETRGCSTVEELRVLLDDEWPYLTDAIEQAATLSNKDWVFAKKNARNKKPEIAMRVIEIAGYVMLPGLLIRMSQVCRQMHVCDGTALIRLLECAATVKEEEATKACLSGKSGCTIEEPHRHEVEWNGGKPVNVLRTQPAVRGDKPGNQDDALRRVASIPEQETLESWRQDEEMEPEPSDFDRNYRKPAAPQERCATCEHVGSCYCGMHESEPAAPQEALDLDHFEQNFRVAADAGDLWSDEYDAASKLARVARAALAEYLTNEEKWPHEGCRRCELRDALEAAGLLRRR